MLSTHKKAKCYAGGGLINSLFGGKTESVSEKYARQDAERAAKAPKPAAAAAPAAAPAAGTISGYAAGTAMRDREKAAGLKAGGAIRGPGTSTSDSIPIMASAGEFMIKAKAVEKIGVPALEALNAIADKPSDKPIAKLGAKRKKQALASGGMVEDPNERAAFGVYPQLAGSKRTSYATDNALRSGVMATGPDTFAPALTPATPQGPAIVGNGPGTRMTAQQDPRSTLATSPAMPTPTVATAATPATPGAPAQATLPNPAAPAPGGVIRRIGNSYSGTDVGAGATIDNARNPGAGVTTIPGGAVSGTPSVDASLAAARTAAADRGDFGAVRASYAAQGQGFGADGMSNEQLQRIAMSPAGTIGRTFARKQLLANQETETARRGQDATAKVATERLSIEKRAADTEQAAKQGLIAAQSAYMNAKTPKAKAEAEETLRALQGRYEKTPTDKFTVVPEYDGNGVRVGTTVLDQSGKVVNPKGAAAPPTAGTVKDGYKFKGGNPADQKNWVKV